jgi:hypothetical protein
MAIAVAPARRPSVTTRQWEVDHDLLPTEDDVLFYEEHGYWVSPKILPDELIDEAMLGAERHWAGERDWPLPISNGYSDWKAGEGVGLRNNEFVSLQNRQLRAVIEHPAIGLIAARLSRSRIVRLYDDQLVSKPPVDGTGGAVVGWHTDRAYWMNCTSPDMLTAWVPLHDCPAEMGPVVYIDGSHKWPNVEELRHFNTDDLGALQTRIMGDSVEPLKRVMAIRKGQVSFHHAGVVHGSGINRGSFPRTSLAVHLQDERNRYRAFHNERGLWVTPNDLMCRRGPDGLPDYTDPAVFPVLHEAGG